jgi:hypothetical protein
MICKEIQIAEKGSLKIKPLQRALSIWFFHNLSRGGFSTFRAVPQSADLAVAMDHVFVAGQFLQPHGTARVKLLG